MAIPNTYRFFVSPESISGARVELIDSALVHQLTRVLRLRPGQQVLLLDGIGNAYEVTLTELGRERVTGLVERRVVATGEPVFALTLYVALLRAERFEWVLQKGTEIGVQAFVPVQCTHSLPADRAADHKLARWQRIVREAAEQSCRGRLPTVAPPQSFASACADAATTDDALILREDAADHLRAILRGYIQQSPGAHPRSMALLSGPEGGFSAEELTTATEHGIMPASLGPRILRAETAPIVAAAAIFYEFE